VIIDTGPDFRMQALREGIDHVDAVFYTHSHADHVLGLDDLRPLSFKHPNKLPLYAEESAARVIERMFDYTFDANAVYPTRARVTMHRLGNTVEIGGAVFHRVPLTHGRLTVAGFRFGNAAYLTDLSDIPDQSMAMLEGLEVVIMDALRRTPHASHANLEKALVLVNRMRPQKAFFTHMSHELLHAEVNQELPAHIQLAYDGLRIPFEI
jgi:phosphoribosyl 1,2-cyclic phosphate phosphodiesterase